jgi:subtilase family serine protease
MKHCYWFFTVTVFLLQIVIAIQAEGQQQLYGTIPADIERMGLKPISRLDSTRQLHLAIGLPLRNQEACTSLLEQIYDPASPEYHHYLTPDEFTARFGPTDQDYQKVIAFAEAKGMKVIGMHPDRVLLDVSGAVAGIERAFHVEFRVYNHPRESRTFYAPDVEPVLDLSVPVIHISGFTNYSLPRPRSKAISSAANPGAASIKGSGSQNGYFFGRDFRAAYAPNVTQEGQGQAVGIVAFDGFDIHDITDYEDLMQIPHATVTTVLLPNCDGLQHGLQLEVCLDIEMAIAMAPQCTVIVYEAPSDNWDDPATWEDVLDRMYDDNSAKQLSCSWGMDPEAGANPTADVIFLQMAFQGQSFLDASGDTDAIPGGFLNPFPGDSPYITQVGGTTLTTNGPGGSYNSETVWNRHDPIYGIGSTGGISIQYPIPLWQQGIDMTSNHGSATMRNTPDVALTAENVYVRAGGQPNYVGGTSCAAPLWAGFIALVNQKSLAIGGGYVGFLNPSIYSIGKGPQSQYAADFHDVTLGVYGNTWANSSNYFYATAGYDLCTGWGSPNGLALVNDLVLST